MNGKQGIAPIEGARLKLRYTSSSSQDRRFNATQEDGAEIAAPRRRSAVSPGRAARHADPSGPASSTHRPAAGSVPSVPSGSTGASAGRTSNTRRSGRR